MLRYSLYNEDQIREPDLLESYGSDNSTAAENQQERPAFAGILRDFTPGPIFEGMIKSELHGDMQE
jgi:hypothetical protein